MRARPSPLRAVIREPLGGILPAVVLAFALSLSGGCSLPPLDAARLSLGTAVLAYDAALPSVEASRAAEGQACLAPAVPAAEAEPCLVAVRQRWAPVRAAVERAWASLEAARAVLALADAVDAMGGRPALDKVRAAVLAAVEAVGVAVSGVRP